MARMRAPHFRGTLFCLVAGVAFSVSPILIQIAYDHGAAVSGVLAWRYLAATVLLLVIARRKGARCAGQGRACRIRPRGGRVRTRFGALLRLARADIGAARVARPLRPSRARRRCCRDDRAGAPHAAAAHGARRDLRRRRPRRCHRHEPESRRRRDGARLRGRVRGLHPACPIGSCATRIRSRSRHT